MTTRPLTLEPEVSPLAARPVDLAAERAVTEPTVISPLKKERPETCTEAVAVVDELPAEPVTEDETDAAVAIDPSPGNARLPLADLFGGPETPPAVAPPTPGAETEMPNASALGVPALVADGAPAEPVSARTASRLRTSECRPTTSPDYWQSGALSPSAGEIRQSGRAGAACAPEDDVVAVDPERRFGGDLPDRMLEPVVRKGLDAAAPAADQMMVMVAASRRRLVVRAAGPEVEPVDEPELGERLERPVDAGNADPRPPLTHPIVDLLGGETARLSGKGLNHGRSGPPRLVAGGAKNCIGMQGPIHGRDDNDSRS
jgi:hypothetical protein